MTEENKNVKKFPNLRFTGFENEWEVKKLGEIANKIGDGLHGTPDYTDNSEYYFINGNNLVNGRIEIFDNTKKVSNHIFAKNNKDLKENTLLISINGTIGSIAKYNGEKVMLGKSVGYFNFKNNSDFIYFTLHTRLIQDYFFSELTGSTIKNLSLKTLRETSIYLPSSEEQYKISCFLSLVEDRIQTQRKIIEGLSLQKISIVKKLFENKIKFKTDNKTHSWERKKLSEISEEHLHKNPNNKYNEVFSVAKHKGVINQIEHLGRSFSAKEILHYKLVYPGDLVYTKSPTSDFPFGIIKQNRTGRIGVVSPLYCVFTPKTYALGYLLHEYFNSSVNTFNYLNPLVQKGAKNTMNINNEIFLNGASILLPMDEEEQKKIYEILLRLDEKINLETELFTQYENQKKYLLQNLFI
ncbi:restriction endonuclease subunit S [Elizabethkingia anophelis]|nr:restriction endonuclease subunit S [Elizabethkingia anophelis]MCT4278903.1 restriction endonuclease subunit S [Elizabethkingia anophelis]